MEYSNNDLTQMVEDEFFAYDFEKEELPGREKMEKFDPLKNFVRYVHKMACECCGYEGKKEDTDLLVKFVLDRCKEEGVGISRQTLSNWLNKGMPKSDQKGRNNIYGLCFALHMNEKQTKEFFLKAYLERPFYHKNIEEAVYFFCMRNGLKYKDAEEIIKNIPDEISDNPDADELTAQIRDRLCEIKDKDELVAYICENRAGFAKKNQTAQKEFANLLEHCKEIAQQEVDRDLAIEPDRYDFQQVESVGNLLQVIYGYNARATKNGKPVYSRSINKSRFPEYIRKNWPQEEQFAQIEKGIASFDVVRRALIVLQFYDYTATVKLNNKEELENSGIYDDLTDEINEMLARCGYGRLYWLNPFDCMFGYCAMSTDPLDTLHDLIEEYYLRDFEEADEPEE